MNKPMNKNGIHSPKRKLNKKTLSRLIKELFKSYPVLVPVTIFCILFSAIVSSIPAIFIQKVIAVISEWYESGNWAAAKAEIIPKISVLILNEKISSL